MGHLDWVPGCGRGRGPRSEAGNLGSGWVGSSRFSAAAFENGPLRIINDAAMQALGNYEGGRMLFLGLGTGLRLPRLDCRTGSLSPWSQAAPLSGRPAARPGPGPPWFAAASGNSGGA